MLSICTVKYCFSYVEFDQYGSTNDSSVLRSSGLYKGFETKNFNIPPLAEIKGIENPPPYYILGDAIFPFKSWLMRQCSGLLDGSQKMFIYLLSSARRTIENVFGILVARWRIFKRPILVSLETVQSVIGACICLHNCLKTTQISSYSLQGFMDVEGFYGTIKEGEWRNTVGSCCALTSSAKA